VDAAPIYYLKEIDSHGYVKGVYSDVLEEQEKVVELREGSVEFVVNEDYTARPPKEPTYFFLIDISKSSFEKNIPYYTLYAIKECL